MLAHSGCGLLFPQYPHPGSDFWNRYFHKNKKKETVSRIRMGNVPAPVAYTVDERTLTNGTFLIWEQYIKEKGKILSGKGPILPPLVCSYE